MREFLKRKILALPTIDAALPNTGTIADLGCGEGIASAYFAQKSTRNLLGIDLNAKKIRQAKDRTHNQPNLSFAKDNIITVTFPQKLSGIVIADVLHHLSLKQQRQLLQNCYRNLKGGGVLVIKEINQEDMIRSTLSRLWDFIFYPQDKINYYTKTKLMRELKNLHFSVTHQQVDRLLPASVNVYIATKI